MHMARGAMCISCKGLSLCLGNLRKKGYFTSFAAVRLLFGCNCIIASRGFYFVDKM